MTRLKRYTSFTELKSNSNYVIKRQHASQSEELKLKDFLDLLRRSLLPKDKDKKETKDNKH